MDENPQISIERLWEQILCWNPKFQDNIEQKLEITKKLQMQLVTGRAVVRIKTLEVEYDELHKSCESKIKELKHIFEKANIQRRPMEENLNSDIVYNEGDIKHDACEDSADSDNEQLSVVAKKCRQTNSCNNEDHLTVALDNDLGNRIQSPDCSFVETPIVKQLKQPRAKRQVKRPVLYCCEEDADCNRETHHSLHIEIPRFFLQGTRHHLYLGNKLSEETFSDVALDAKTARKSYGKCSTKKPKQSQKKRQTVMTSCSSSISNSQITSEQVEFSQFVRQIMPGDGSEDEETWQAARALECINMDRLFSFSTQDDEAPICCAPSTSKKRRKSTKPNNKSDTVKRSRKSKNKDSPQVQPPTKSNLAQYVENFSNDCGSATPAASSTMSQPLVSSTTQNIEFIDQQDPGTVMCYIEGDWANGGSCQLVTSNGLSISSTQMRAENMIGATLPYQENTLDGNLGLPISMPFTSFDSRPMYQTAPLQNAITQPIFNIQIPTLPVATTTIISSSLAGFNGIKPPPPAHIISNCVLDLSVKSKTRDSINTASIDKPNIKYNSDVLEGDDDATAAVPLDLSIKSTPNQSLEGPIVTEELDTTEFSESHCGVAEDNSQYFNFALCLNELEFDSSDDKPCKGKDMPLLECSNDQQDLLIRDSTKSLSTGCNDIYSMNEENSEFHSCVLGEEFQFANQSTKEIFDNLLDIGPLTTEDDETVNRNTASFLGLDNETFDYNAFGGTSTLKIAENAIGDSIDDDEVTPNDQRLYLGGLIQDTKVSLGNITDKCFNSSETVENIINGPSNIVENCELRNIEGARDSQQNNIAEIIKDIDIPVHNCADTSSYIVQENTATTSATLTTADKFVATLKQSHVTVNDIDLTKASGEYVQKNLQKPSEKPSDINQEECTNNLEIRLSDTKPNSTENIYVANDDNVAEVDAITSSDQCHNIQKSIIDSVLENTEVASSSVDKCEHQSTCNESYSNKDVGQSDENINNRSTSLSPKKIKTLKMQTTPTTISSGKLPILAATTETATINCCTRKKLDETDIEKLEEIDPKCVNAVVQPMEIDTNSSASSIKKIVFSVLKVDLSDESVSLDNAFENCESIPKISPSREFSLIPGENMSPQLLTSSIGIDFNDSDRHSISNDTDNVPYVASRGSLTQHNKALANTKITHDTILNLSKNSEIEWKISSNGDVLYDLENAKNKCINTSEVYTSSSTNNAETVNSASSKVLDNTNLKKSPRLDTSIHVRTLEHLETFSSNDTQCIENPSTSLTIQQTETENKTSCKVLLNTSLEDDKPRILNTSDDEQTVEPLGNDKQYEDIAVKVSTSLTNQNVKTDNPTTDKVLDNISLEKLQAINNSNHLKTAEHLEISMGNDTQYEGITEEPCNSNCASVGIPKYTSLDLASMSLLEMESKLEDAIVDFENDFDDAISLTTSCFDSPNESRFMESLLIDSNDDNDDDVSKATNTVTNSSSNLVAKPASKSSLEDLRCFKIPKFKKAPSAEQQHHKQEGTTNMSISCNDIAHINHFTLQPSVRLEKISINKDGNIVRKDDRNVASKSKVLNKPVNIKIEKITRIIKNENANTNTATISGNLSHMAPPQQLFHFEQKVPIIINTIQNNNNSSNIINDGKVVSHENISKIFGITCLPYLVDRCLKSPVHCQYSHQFKDIDTVFSSINSLNKVQLIAAYAFMYKHKILYKSYFGAFCNIYTIRHDRNKLLNMIIDCDRYPQYSEFLFILYEGLVKCGLSRVNSCRHILKRVRDRSTGFIDALVAIIIKSNWTMFADYLESFAQAEQHTFRFGTLEHMSQAVLHSNDEHLKVVFGKCFQMMHSDDASLLVNSPNVIEWVNLFIKPQP